ncbi:olfactory receptor 51E1-like [Mastomys coucha]|uniref:olfactory receptor 51E1-like n=1 Tax=Mastomys coucha TaxID=35658 RepID=UPI00126218E5|nr:olfactory receptor 51E1-like [Mastomys coucha]
MEPANKSQLSPRTFWLMGIPGLEHLHVWIGIPFCSMYVVALMGNVTILAVVRAEHSLHEPMFLFLCMLSVTDLVLSTSTLPRMLCLFWMEAHDITFDACLPIMFFIHSFTAMESGFFLAMAIDQYVAICDPLRHTTILTNPRVASLGLAILVRSIGLHIPAPIMLKKLPYCQKRHLSHSYCLHPDVMKLACTDTRINSAYGLFVVLSTLGVDSVLIVLSYGLILYTTWFMAWSKLILFKKMNHMETVDIPEYLLTNSLKLPTFT